VEPGGDRGRRRTVDSLLAAKQLAAQLAQADISGDDYAAPRHQGVS
jgi:hypothetical protein